MPETRSDLLDSLRKSFLLSQVLQDTCVEQALKQLALDYGMELSRPIGTDTISVPFNTSDISGLSIN